MILKHITSIDDISAFSERNKILEFARMMQNWRAKSLYGKVMAVVYYESASKAKSSVGARLSLESAMYKLGGGVSSIRSVSHLSYAVEGPALEDEVRWISANADVVVLNNPKRGYIKRALAVSSVPIINAGGGIEDQPVQALADLFTIRKKLRKTEGLDVGVVGNLSKNKSVHSLLELLSFYRDNKVFLVSPPHMKLPDKYKDYLRRGRTRFKEECSITKIFGRVDVLYLTGVERNMFKSELEYEELKRDYTIEKKDPQRMRENAIILHTWPRAKEAIAPEVNKDKRAIYLTQPKDSLQMSMAILKYILEK